MNNHKTVEKLHTAYIYIVAQILNKEHTHKGNNPIEKNETLKLQNKQNNGQ